MLSIIILSLMIQNLPKEIFDPIVSYLKPFEIKSFSLVNKNFYNILHHSRNANIQQFHLRNLTALLSSHDAKIHEHLILKMMQKPSLKFYHDDVSNLCEISMKNNMPSITLFFLKKFNIDSIYLNQDCLRLAINNYRREITTYDKQENFDFALKLNKKIIRFFLKSEKLILSKREFIFAINFACKFNVLFLIKLLVNKKEYLDNFDLINSLILYYGSKKETINKNEIMVALLNNLPNDIIKKLIISAIEDSNHELVEWFLIKEKIHFELEELKLFIVCALPYRNNKILQLLLSLCNCASFIDGNQLKLILPSKDSYGSKEIFELLLKSKKFILDIHLLNDLLNKVIKYENGNGHICFKLLMQEFESNDFEIDVEKALKNAIKVGKLYVIEIICKKYSITLLEADLKTIFKNAVRNRNLESIMLLLPDYKKYYDSLDLFQALILALETHQYDALEHLLKHSNFSLESLEIALEKAPPVSGFFSDPTTLLKDHFNEIQNVEKESKISQIFIYYMRSIFPYP